MVTERKKIVDLNCPPLLEVPLMSLPMFLGVKAKMRLIMKRFFSLSILRILFVTVLACVWAGTPALAQRYFSFNDYSGFSLFGSKNLWDVLRKDFKLQHEAEHPFIKAEISWFSSNQKNVDRTVARATPYLYYVREQLKQRNLPGELALLPIVESAYNPFALSHKGAAGIWQFMPETAKFYGLKLNSWYDGRRDIVESTRAALDHLTRLHKKFDGDWLLAIAAYNSGEGMVQSAIDRNRRLGKSTDFWSLSLPEETKRYVPRLIAIANVVNNPKSYDVELSPIRNVPYFTQVDLNSTVNLAQAAKAAEIDVAHLHALNAGYKRTATDPSQPSRLLLPIKAVNKFNTQFNDDDNDEASRFDAAHVPGRFDQSKKTNVFHQFAVALKNTFSRRTDKFTEESEHHVRAAAKSTPSESRQAVEQQRSMLTASLATATGRATKAHQTITVKRIEHEVGAGETLYELARRYGVPVQQIARWNHVGTDHKLKLGEMVALWIDATSVTQV